MSDTATHPGLTTRIAAFRDRFGADEARAICPTDHWAFRPRYTDGRCPLCGWEPPGVIVRLPMSRRIDTFGWMSMALGAVSLIMLLLVLLIYMRT
jgi:hypothetical protein